MQTEKGMYKQRGARRSKKRIDVSIHLSALLSFSHNASSVKNRQDSSFLFLSGPDYVGFYSLAQ